MVVAYITLVAPAEIVLFIERQLSDEGTLAAGRHLAVAIDVTNVMQTVRPSHTNLVRSERVKRFNSSSPDLRLRATGRHLPYGITQCYLPPDTSERAPP